MTSRKLLAKLQQGLGLLLIGLFLVGCGPQPGTAGSGPQAAAPTTIVPTAAASPTMDAPATLAPTAAPAPVAPWSLVVVGDSIPYNSPSDCPGCTGFVDRYATGIFQATGHPVQVQNLSQHNNLGTDGLLKELQSDTARRAALAGADIIIVSIGGNDIAWNINDDPCDGPTTDSPDWSKFNPTCAAAAAEIFRPKLESVYSQIAALRAGKPTIFRTNNRYNDFIDANFPPEGVKATHDLVEAWNAMLCPAAQAHGFTCADIYHAFNGSDGITPAGDLLAGDYTHPSDKGNEVIANVLTALGYAPLATTGLTPIPTPRAASPTNIPAPTATLAALPTAASVPTSTALIQFIGHSERVRYASFSPDGTLVVTAGGDGTARLWEVASGKELLQFKGHTDAVECAVFSPNGKTVLTCSWDQTARLWDVATGRQLLLFGDDCDVIRRAAFSPDGTMVVTTCDDGIARVWDAQTAKVITTFRGHEARTHVNRVAFAPDGKTVVTSGDDGTARLWDPRTGQEIMVFKGHTDLVAGVAFSPDGTNLLTASFDSSVRLWDVGSGQELRRFAGHPGGAYGAAYSPDGKTVVTSGADQMVRLWDVQTGAEVRRFVGHTSAVRIVLFSPDGQYILTSSDDNTARLWRIETTTATP